jgi:hypothetical protein
MDILDQFADDVTEINISDKNIEGILDFKRFTKLTKLYCSENKIETLNNLPETLRVLTCYDNEFYESKHNNDCDESQYKTIFNNIKIHLKYSESDDDEYVSDDEKIITSQIYNKTNTSKQKYWCYIDG